MTAAELVEKHAECGTAVVDLAELLEWVRLDQFLHTHPSRRMSAEETFRLNGRRVRLHFDYQHTSPVNGEAAYCVVEPEGVADFV